MATYDVDYKKEAIIFKKMKDAALEKWNKTKKEERTQTKSALEELWAEKPLKDNFDNGFGFTIRVHFINVHKEKFREISKDRLSLYYYLLSVLNFRKERLFWEFINNREVVCMSFFSRRPPQEDRHYINKFSEKDVYEIEIFSRGREDFYYYKFGYFGFTYIDRREALKMLFLRETSHSFLQVSIFLEREDFQSDFIDMYMPPHLSYPFVSIVCAFLCH